MNFIKRISKIFGKKIKSGNALSLQAEESAQKSVELNVPNAKVKRRKQRRGY